jgi:glycerol kinase
MTYVLAIDQGTSSTRAVVYDSDGRSVGSAQQTFDLVLPRDGWVEQDPAVLWDTTLATGRGAISAAGVDPAAIAAIGITNQRETTLVWDAHSGEPVHNAIVWLDRRTARRCQQIAAEGMSDVIGAATGLVVDPYFSSTKLAWLLDEMPGLRARAERGDVLFGTVDSYLIWRLTRGRHHVTDATNASRTQLFNLDTQAWDDELLRYFRIPATMLPTVHDTVSRFGECDPAWFGAAIPIVGVAGDQQAALIGQACLSAGMSKATYGTGCFIVTHTGERRVRSANGLLTTVAYRIDGVPSYAVEGSIFSAGVTIKWARDRLHLLETAAESEAAARRAGGDAGGVYVVPAFTGLGAPHWQPHARGLICGLTLDTNPDQLITAMLQSVAFQTEDLLAALAADGARVERLRIDGGMVVNDWLCQALADITAIDVERPVDVETTARGAALLALVGSGTVPSLAHAAHLWQLDRRFGPAMPAARRIALLHGWRQALARAAADFDGSSDTN